MKKFLKPSLIIMVLCMTILPLISIGYANVFNANDNQAVPLNFADFPEAFDGGVRPWDLDIIDKEWVDPSITGEGVYVAVLDTGLVSHWKHFFPEERIKEEWGRSFVDRGVMREEKNGCICI